MDLIQIRKEFKELKKKCKGIEIENRKLIDSSSKPKVYSTKDVEDEGNDNEIASDSNVALLNTTLGEFEKRKKSSTDKHTYNLAKLTYDKEIKISKKNRTHNDSKNDKLDNLVKHMNTETNKRYKIQKRRGVRDEQLGHGYINQKNQQFNAKLEKEQNKKEGKE